jgi:glycosyltransferase involved in cell wall biosynthesis
MNDAKTASDGPLVSVIVPAYNASRTIGRTLTSILRQTYNNIEVIVVDDGSNDNTCQIVSQFIAADQRVRLIRKSNGGVASARNAAIEQSQGELIAPIDADDLWHATRLERHVNAFRFAPANVAVVYSPFRAIDNDDRVFHSSYVFQITGWVLFRDLYVNIVGNGSGMTFRRQAVVAAGGYQSWLRSAGAEGCEDFLLQVTIATRCRFVTVPEFLIGYRHNPERMSSDSVRIIRSQILAFDEITRRCNALPLTPLYLIRLKHRTKLLIEMLRSGLYRELLSELNLLRNKDMSVVLLVPLVALALVIRSCRWLFYQARKIIKMKGQPTDLQYFFDLAPDQRSGPPLPLTMAGFLTVLGAVDRWCACEDGYSLNPDRRIRVRCSNDDP